MSKERPNRIDQELFKLEDGVVNKRLEALAILGDANSVVRSFIDDHDGLVLNLNIKTPTGEKFKLDVLPHISMILFNIANKQWTELNEMGEGQRADEIVKRDVNKWK